MARKPVLEVLWQSTTTSNVWLVFAMTVGAVSLYVFLMKKPPGGGRCGSPAVPSVKDDKSSLLKRMQQRQFKGHRLCVAWEVLTDHGQWREHARETLMALALDMEVYVMCRIKCKEDKKAILAMLWEMPGLMRHRILFCETAKGYESFCRQIKPAVVVTHNEEQASFLSAVLPNVVLVGAKVPETAVTCISSIHELLQECAA
ncbi:hypothetical protein TraAM80_03928 [Trypanosoma rangeli]|uniref:Peroxisome assembly protein 22 n=1 Tax=Trypanosoma rangeli TaxID=5698 RepID=A0A422NM43_TRYRA|nr:uncharacterized protein TraAM80_03928 [Trypanosoma rangeli]RNF06474.1 hypothetical protein TraAM80_03928 [Trypanosoma rangeli]|eukprot:RNF06474.1 hypothetical protein TraAM80_03928 [Trypanosoma rangeli]